MNNIDFVKLYELLGVKNISHTRENQAIGLCPLHQDTRNSFAFEITTGLWKCFAGCGEGNKYHLINKLYGTINSDSDDVAAAILNPIKEDYLRYNDSLLNNSRVMEVFFRKRGLSIETIKKYKIGYDGDRFTIPIFIGNVLVNIRKYSIESSRAKMLNVDGFGSIKLYPFENIFKEGTIYIFEGELDAILANQVGINGISVTSGAGAWRKEWAYLLKGRDIVICYDVDSAGKKGAQAVAKNISAFAKSVKIINLPLNEPKGADFTNYIVDFSHKAEDFLKLVEETSLPKIPSAAGDAPVGVSAEVFETDLKGSSGQEFYFKRVKLPVIVSGKDLTPFIIPSKMKAKCLNVTPNEKDIKSKCLNCRLSRNSEETIIIDETQQTVLKLIYSSDTQIKGYLREAANIPQTCHKFALEVLETQNVEECRLIPEVDFSTSESEYVARVAYFIGNSIKTNSSYVIEGVGMPNPKNQYATILFNKATPKQRNIDVFKLTPAIINELKIFQPIDGQSIDAKLDEIYEDFTYNVTRIYHRQDLLTAIDLSFFSVLEFNFLREYICKGYSEVLVIGDTRCGKTKTIQSIVEHYKAGEFITGENATFSGLVGGMSQVGNKWHITWGKLPLNDRKLVVIDEASSLTEETISNMSAIRSSGVAEIIKIQTERTKSRCRIIWLSNPRSGKKLNNYNHGILAVRELIGKVEDIARLDLAISVASDDVDLTSIQTESNKNIKHKYTGLLNNTLLLWAWSRKKENIIFLPETEDAIIEVANKLSDLYSSAIPLVEPAEQRIKIARLSAAIAVRLFSCDESGENVIIKPEHALFIFEYLKIIYNKKSMAYNLFSSNQFVKTKMTDSRRLILIQEFKKRFNSWDSIRDVLLENQYFRKTEFIDQTGLNKEEAKDFFTWATKNRLIQSTSGGYRKNPIFTELLKQILDDIPDEAEGGF